MIDKLIRSSGGMEGDISQSTVTAWGINVGSKLASGVAKVCSNIFSGSTKPATSPGKTSVIFMLFIVSDLYGHCFYFKYYLRSFKRFKSKKFITFQNCMLYYTLKDKRLKRKINWSNRFHKSFCLKSNAREY